MSHDSTMKQITGYQARGHGFDCRHARLIVTQCTSATIINEPQCSQGNSIFKIYTEPSPNLLTTVLRSCYIIMSSRRHSLSVSIKIVKRPLSTMGRYACTLESMVSHHYPPCTECKTRVIVSKLSWAIDWYAMHTEFF